MTEMLRINQELFIFPYVNISFTHIIFCSSISRDVIYSEIMFKRFYLLGLSVIELLMGSSGRFWQSKCLF